MVKIPVFRPTSSILLDDTPLELLSLDRELNSASNTINKNHSKGTQAKISEIY
jgi:hypothetical protein